MNASVAFVLFVIKIPLFIYYVLEFPPWFRIYSVSCLNSVKFRMKLKEESINSSNVFLINK